MRLLLGLLFQKVLRIPDAVVSRELCNVLLETTSGLRILQLLFALADVELERGVLVEGVGLVEFGQGFLELALVVEVVGLGVKHLGHLRRVRPGAVEDCRRSGSPLSTLR